MLCFYSSINLVLVSMRSSCFFKYFSHKSASVNNKSLLSSLEMCNLSNNIMDYYFVSQGKTTIPNVDDGEELLMTDVRHRIDRIYLFIFLN